jgi:hypothetical protein
VGSSKDCLRRLMRKHGQVTAFVAADHCSAECVGIHAALHGTRHDALEAGRQGFRIIENLREALIALRQTCNGKWPIQQLRHRSPANFRRDQVNAQTMAAQIETRVSETRSRTGDACEVFTTAQIGNCQRIYFEYP